MTMTIEFDERLGKAFTFISNEMAISNITESLETKDIEILKAHDSVHEFMRLAHLSYGKNDETWHEKSAFLLYHWETFHSAHVAIIDALAGYYNAGYVLLRNALELYVKGAFWQCLGHRRFRDSTRILDEDAKKDGKRISIKDWIEALIEQTPSIKEDLEKTSAGIFDKMAVLFEDENLQREYVRIPSFSVIVKQLVDWKVIDISQGYEVVYNGLYRRLSKDVHVIPDSTDIGRRILREKDLFKINVIPEELNKFMKTLCEIMDIGIVVELNVLIDWIQSDEVKTALKGRVDVMENLGLELGLKKLDSLVQS